MALRPEGLIAVRFGSLPKPPDVDAIADFPAQDLREQ